MGVFQTLSGGNKLQSRSAGVFSVIEMEHEEFKKNILIYDNKLMKIFNTTINEPKYPIFSCYLPFFTFEKRI